MCGSFQVVGTPCTQFNGDLYSASGELFGMNSQIKAQFCASDR